MAMTISFPNLTAVGIPLLDAVYGSQTGILIAIGLAVVGFSGAFAQQYRFAAADVGNPASELSDLGFRVASVPEPGSIALLLAGAVSLLAYAWRRRSAS